VYQVAISVVHDKGMVDSKQRSALSDEGITILEQKKYSHPRMKTLSSFFMIPPLAAAFVPLSSYAARPASSPKRSGRTNG